MTLQEIKQEYTEARQKYNEHVKSGKEAERIIEEKIELRKKQIERLEKKLKKQEAKTYGYEEPHHFTECYLRPIADEIMARTGYTKCEIYGPFGLDAECSFYIKNNNGDIEYSLSMPSTFPDEEFLYIDIYTDTQQYKEGTIGWLNGWNHPKLPLPETIEGIMEIAKVKIRRITL